jgi:hypothetical protein
LPQLPQKKKKQQQISQVLAVFQSPTDDLIAV